MTSRLLRIQGLKTINLAVAVITPRQWIHTEQLCIENIPSAALNSHTDEAVTQNTSVQPFFYQTQHSFHAQT